MKRILTALCTLALLVAGVTPAMAQPAAIADPTLAVESPAPSPSPEPGRSCYYPISVEKYTYGPLDELRVSKVYQLSLGDDPRGIPTEDFDRGGRHFYLLDMTRKDEVGVDTQTHTETVTLASDTNKMDDILARLNAELECTTEDGYTGSTSSRYATGYTITANYTGEVAKTDCSVVTYTAIFGSVENPGESEAPEVPEESARPDEPGESAASIPWVDLKTPLMIGGMALILVIGGMFAFKKIKRR